MSFLTEKGLYRVICRSNKPIAEKLREIYQPLNDKMRFIEMGVLTSYIIKTIVDNI
jgi:hypothetical protein